MAQEKDIWQAASLLIGIYGEHALSYVTSQILDLEQQDGCTSDLFVWQQIADRIADLLTRAPVGSVH